MTDTKEMPSSEPFQCSHCVTSGEISFSSYQKQQQQSSVKVWVNNLPDGISESGVKNLFLTVGKPLTITYNPKNRSALVEFHLLNEAELAVRDLHCKPPYHLKVRLFTPKIQKEDETNEKKVKQDENEEVWDFSTKEPQSTQEQDTKDEENKKENEMVHHITNVVRNLNYNPSIRIRQKKLDFRTGSGCVSLGRGYMFRGNTDCSVGGLQKFEFASENSKAKNEMSYSCEKCNAMTTKKCGRCSASYCSKVCLTNHQRNCGSDINTKAVSKRLINSQTPNNSISQVSLLPNSTVVISTYFTMRTVCVRRSDDIWEEKFSRLCNDLAAEAFKGEKLEEKPEVGDLVIAKYYEDFCYYRGKVISQCNNKVEVCFIDFGNIQETHLDDLRPLPEYLKSVPGLAVKVQLKGVSNESSLDSVDYFNKLTADRVLLVLNFDKATGEVVLIEKDSKAVVNETVANLALPSWKKDKSVLSKSGEVFKLNSIERQILEIGKTLTLIVSHFDEREFLESEVLWVVSPHTDEFFHANSQMQIQIREYCEYLKDDYYLPRENELCLAKEDGNWQRCVNLKSQKTTCCLFFIDDGHSSFITTNNIRKMIADFIETPAQAICCTLPENPKLKNDKEIQSKVVNFLKESIGQTLDSVFVLKLMGDAYCLSVPEINKILE